MAQPSRTGSWWMWIGGILGAIYVAAVAVLDHETRQRGALHAGHLRPTLDGGDDGPLRLGIGLEKHPISAPRILGIILVFAGVVLVRKS